MTELDKAHAALKADPENPQTKMDFYLLFLNSIFFVPIKKVNERKNSEKKVELHLVLSQKVKMT